MKAEKRKNKASTFSQALARARGASGMSRLELATKLGCDESLVYKWERDTKVPTESRFHELVGMFPGVKNAPPSRFARPSAAKAAEKTKKGAKKHSKPVLLSEKTKVEAASSKKPVAVPAAATAQRRAKGMPGAASGGGAKGAKKMKPQGVTPHVATGSTPKGRVTTTAPAKRATSSKSERGGKGREASSQSPFGHSLRAARIEAAYTAEQFAKRIGVSASLLSQWENGSKVPNRSRTETLVTLLPDLRHAQLPHELKFLKTRRRGDGVAVVTTGTAAATKQVVGGKGKKAGGRPKGSKTLSGVGSAKAPVSGLHAMATQAKGPTAAPVVPSAVGRALLGTLKKKPVPAKKGKMSEKDIARSLRDVLRLFRKTRESRDLAGFVDLLTHSESYGLSLHEVGALLVE